MADLKKAVEIIFQGDDQVSKVAQAAFRSIDSAAGDLGGLADPFAEATEAALALTAVVAGIGVAGIIASADLEKQSKKMAASLGLLPEEAERFRKVAAEVYSGGFGEDLADSFEAVALAQKKLGDAAGEDLGKITEHAIQIRDLFGADLDQTFGASSTLIKQFGLTAQESFDFIASGFQKGLDGSGDFLESITEYSNQFANGGADAGEFFSVLESGFSEGVLGTDKAADAFKEFRVRIQDGSEGTAEALALIGIDNEELQRNLSTGKTTVIETFNTVISKLNEVDDSSVVMQAGVGLIGTQFEDLGTAASLALDTTKTKITDLSGAMDSINIDGFGKSALKAWRALSLSFAEIPLFEGARDRLGKTLGEMAKLIPEAFEGADYSEIQKNIDDIAGTISGFFRDVDADLTTAEGIGNALQFIVDSVASLTDVTGGILEAFKPIFVEIKGLFDRFNALGEGTKEAIGNILAIGTAVATVAGAVAGISVVTSALSGLVTTVGSFAGITAGATALGGLAALLAPLAAAGAAGAGVAFLIKELSELTPVIENLPKEPINLKLELDSGNILDVTTGIIHDIEGNVVSVPVEFETEEEKTKRLAQEAKDEILDALATGETPGVIQYVIDGDTEALSGALDELGVLVIEADTGPAQKEIEQVIMGYRESGEPITLPVEVLAEDAKKTIDEIGAEIPTEKMMEIKLQGDIDRELAIIKGGFESVQVAAEWEAKLDIAEAQATAKIMESAFESVNIGIKSTGDLIGNLFSQLKGTNISEQFAIESQIMKENDLRQAQFETQKKLIDSQIKLNQEKAKQVARGEATITVQAEGLAPHLEAIWFQIFEALQVNASEEGKELLLGLNL